MIAGFQDILRVSGATKGLSNVEIDRLYGSKWNFLSAMFVSQSGESINNQLDGYLSSKELEKLSSETKFDSAATTTNWNETPYTSAMKLLSDVSALKTARHTILTNIIYYCLDATKIGSTEQEADVNQAIVDSLAGDVDAKAHTYQANTIPSPWQPNFFRPVFRVNGENALNVSKTVDNNKADRSMGYPLPYDFAVYTHYTDSIQKLESEAMVGQLIDVTGTVSNDGNWIKRYPVFCIANFVYSR